MRKFLKIFAEVFFFVFLLFWTSSPLKADGDVVNLYFFYSSTCPHCAQESAYLTKIAPDYSYLKIHQYEVGMNRENALLLQKIGTVLNVDVRGVPMTFIGNDYFVGYLTDDTTGSQIISLIEKYKDGKDPDILGNIINPDISPTPESTPTVNQNLFLSPSPNVPSEISQSPTPISTPSKEELTNSKNDVLELVPEKIELPIFGTVDTKNLSLPVFTFTVALADGFNPCAMWVLLFLISLLLGMKNRLKMWVLGSAFIFASGLVYFLFLSAWLNLFLFLGFVTWARIIIGLFAIVMGIYQLRDFVMNKSGCKVENDEKRKKIFEKLKSITQRRNFLLALLGIILLAFVVNLVELVCSAGLPAIYSQVLALSNLAPWQYYLYLLFYVFIFMIDDLFVFFIAMTTLKAVGIESKYSVYSRLVGGIVILIIGILMLFKPDLLTFG
jgi:glutaredoxin